MSFKYRVIGSAQLAFVYYSDETSYVSSVVQNSASGGWQDWTGNIPSGSSAFVRYTITSQRERERENACSHLVIVSLSVFFL